MATPMSTAPGGVQEPPSYAEGRQRKRDRGLELGRKISELASENLNFFRIHMLVFTFTPLIASAIFYAANGKNHIPYVDCLFVCMSAMTVTGLTTINISTTTGFQQAMLFFLMCIGNMSAVSVTMVWIRRHFFRKKFDHMVRHNPKMRRKAREVQKKLWKQRQLGLQKVQNLVEKMGGKKDSPAVDGEQGQDAAHSAGEDANSISDGGSSGAQMAKEKKRAAKEKEKKKPKDRKGPLTADMIRRSDQPAVLMNPSVIPSKSADEEGSAKVLSTSPTQANSGGILSRGLTDDENGDTSGQNTMDPQNQLSSIRIAEPNNTTLGRRPSLAVTDDSAHEEDTSYMRAFQRAAARAAKSTSGGRGPDASAGPDANRDLIDVEAVGQEDAQYASIRPSRSADPAFFEEQRSRHTRRGSEGANFPPLSAPADPRQDPMPRAQTIGFAEPAGTHMHHPRTDRNFSGAGNIHQSGPGGNVLRHRSTGLEFERTATRRSMGGASTNMRRTRTSASGIQLQRTLTMSKNSGFGGWPTPIDVLRYLLERVFHNKEMPRTNTIASIHSTGGLAGEGVKTAPYFSFDVLVSRNSKFHELTEDQRDELGGVEYRAIDLLAKFIPGYWLFVNLFFFTLVAPYVTSKAYNKYNTVFDSQAPYTPNRVWWTFFNTVSAYTNTGLSLIDTSMTKQQDAYLPLTAIALLILLGNTGFPIALRFALWLSSKVTPTSSRTHESLRFLLDHPRRCFVYLFPSGQTWFLLFVLVTLNVIDWIMFLVLDIGNPNIESIPRGQRVFDGLFQSIAVRAAGFQVVSLLAIAPAVQVLYTIMMYISVFPIAMSVRSTNVYEEKSLGIFEELPEKQEEPRVMDARVWSRYLAQHARRQLAFDMWWLGFALWLVCIIQRSEIQDPNTNGWFTIFSVLFELTSAYGTVGLSTGTPDDNFSLSGRFNTLGKLVVIAVMLRGRHRGLPVAIDRAVLLPDELEVEDKSVWSFVDDNDFTSASVQPSATFGTSMTRPFSTFSAQGDLEAQGLGVGSESFQADEKPNTQSQRHQLHHPLSVINEKSTPLFVDSDPLNRDPSREPPAFVESPKAEVSLGMFSQQSSGSGSTADKDSMENHLATANMQSVAHPAGESGPSSSEGPHHEAHPLRPSLEQPREQEAQQWIDDVQKAGDEAAAPADRPESAAPER